MVTQTPSIQIKRPSEMDMKRGTFGSEWNVKSYVHGTRDTRVDLLWPAMYEDGSSSFIAKGEVAVYN